MKGKPTRDAGHLTRGQSRPKRSLGQNFLVDPNTARKIVACLGPGPGDRVIEIGPGRGALTEFLLQSGAQVTGIEKDHALARRLKVRWPDLDILAADGMTVDWSRLPPGRAWKVIGNLPYNVASPLIWDLVSTGTSLSRMVFTVQKEVGRRLTAHPGHKEYGALSVWVQTFVRSRLEFVLGRSVFRPRPKVDSAVVSLTPLPEPPAGAACKALSRLLRICFQQRRKQLKTLLRTQWTQPVQDWFDEHGIPPRSRPEDLTPGQFFLLAQHLNTLGALDN